MSFNLVDYNGKTAVVVGAATGMGGATGQLLGKLGARVIAIDIADLSYPVSESIKLDLRDRQAIDRAVADLPEKIDAVFCCAGVADGVPGIMLINFIGQRYLVDQMLETGRLQRGASVSAISSVGGMAWMQNTAQLFEFLDCRDWDSAADWVASHEGTDSYAFSKQAWNGYVSREALNYLKRGMRINAILPGPTDTPLARANADLWLGFGAEYREEAGVDPLSAEQMGNTLLFLGSEAASGINGVILLVDYGHVNCSMTDGWDDPWLGALMAQS
jgi:NAD(P)-dependent dehydrogenase (short-subunit alcohol dehydrogenase family)